MSPAMRPHGLSRREWTSHLHLRALTEVLRKSLYVFKRCIDPPLSGRRLGGVRVAVGVTAAAKPAKGSPLPGAWSLGHLVLL